VMGGTAGIIGATSVYPLDMIKTRLQFQRSGGEQQYKGIIDCFRKIVARDGIRGLYRGLPAQLVGITPEKAIKLTINDLVRFKLTDKKTGQISILSEAIAGATAGFSQVIVTGPYELVKVRLQTQSSADAHSRKGGIAIIRELGFRGLFTGAGATLLRDVPFSAVYFTLYGNLKAYMKDEKGHLSPGTLFFCGISAGSISAVFATPMDVIKTRIQAKSVDRKYNGIRDCFWSVLKEEGPLAFLKGAIPRILIISPLFGITLCVYEVLQGYFLPPGAKV